MTSFREMDKWEGEPFDPTEAESTDEAVFIGRTPTGETVIIGREDCNEWITTKDMGPIHVEEFR
jgi:hypothetical protein